MLINHFIIASRSYSQHLAPSINTFHGIVPGRPVYPLGTITLDVIFGEPTNFRKETIEFEVVDWKSQYHVILGRPVMGGYFIGRPMDPESRPAKTKEASTESQVKSHGLGWRQADQGPRQRRDPSRRSPSTNPEF